MLGTKSLEGEMGSTGLPARENHLVFGRVWLSAALRRFTGTRDRIQRPPVSNED